MTRSSEGRPDLPGDEAGAARTRLVDNLIRAYRAPAPPPHLDAAVLQAVRASAPERRRQHRRPVWAGSVRMRLAALAAALLVALSGVAGYLRLSSPTPVSAQAVLRRAAALQLGPNQAAHMIDNVTMTWDGRTAN